MARSRRQRRGRETLVVGSCDSGMESPAGARTLASDLTALYPQLQRIAAQEVRAFARHRIEADDLAQDCACRLLEGAASPAGARLEEDRIGGWMRLFVRHRALQQAARRARRAAATPGGRRGPFVRDGESAHDLNSPDDFRAIHAAVAKRLPDDVDIVVLLLTINQPLAEIARLLALPTAVVRGRLRRARALVARARGHGCTAEECPHIGPASLVDFLVRGRLEGRALVELAHAAGLGRTRAKQLLRAAGNGLRGGATSDRIEVTPPAS